MDIKYKGDSHYRAFIAGLTAMGYDKPPADGEILALVYLLTLTEDLRQHFGECVNVQERHIRPGVINASWVTGTDARIIRLAFNLFNGGTPTDEDVVNYIPSYIFRYDEYMPYMLEGIRIRYTI